jgi:hypothetical protein
LPPMDRRYAPHHSDIALVKWAGQIIWASNFGQGLTYGPAPRPIDSAWLCQYDRYKAIVSYLTRLNLLMRGRRHLFGAMACTDRRNAVLARESLPRLFLDLSRRWHVFDSRPACFCLRPDPDVLMEVRCQYQAYEDMYGQESLEHILE